jgi:hypothetical protein
MKLWFSKNRQPAYGKTKRCARCGRSYIITSIEISYLRQNDFAEPNQCRSCLKEATAGELFVNNYPHVEQRRPRRLAPARRGEGG